MISRRHFDKLKAGDVVLWGRHRIPRIVQDGPGDKTGDVRYITFAKRRRSQYNRGSTVYMFTDIYKIISLPRRGRINVRALCAAEADHLASIGYDPIESIDKELEDMERLNKSRFWLGQYTNQIRRLKTIRERLIRRQCRT